MSWESEFQAGSGVDPGTLALFSASLVALAILIFVLAVLAIVVPDALSMREPDVVKQGAGVTKVVKLSQYFDGIAGTRGDTDIYVLDSGKPGASALVLGGTHGNEPSGFMAAIVLIENAMPTSGKLYVIPFANASTLTHTDYMEGTPRHFTVVAQIIAVHGHFLHHIAFAKAPCVVGAAMAHVNQRAVLRQIGRLTRGPVSGQVRRAGAGHAVVVR